MNIKPRIYTVATAHLDTSWNWTLETTIREYLPKTFNENFELFEKYPEYKFSLEGSYRYELLEEYYPEAFEQIKDYIEKGSWNVTGSAYENGDVNIPSPEALFRNILFGNDYFNKKFNKRSKDIYLPDCFGFGYALPSVMSHANLSGFTTQKLVWSSAYHIPFDLGIWRGVDGSEVFASFDAMNYTAVLKNVRNNHSVRRPLKENIKKYSLPFTYILHGVGDRGGAPKESSVKVVCDEIAKNAKCKWDVVSASADQVFRDMKNELSSETLKSLPVWDKELVSTDHGVGSYTSRAIGKRWNRRGEQLANAAERASVSAVLLADAKYPQEVLNTAWKRIVAHQFHDDITGTSLSECYLRNWNDYILSLNQLSEEYRASLAHTALNLNTSNAKGIPLIVSNPVQSKGQRKECVTAKLELDKNVKNICVYDTEGKEVESCIINRNDDEVEVSFIASVPSVGMAVYDVRAGKGKIKTLNSLKITKNLLENEKYIVKIDSNGDIASIYDKEIKKELLKSPIRFAIFDYKGSISWPAWELDYDEVSAEPRVYAKNPIIEIAESNNARIMLKITKFAGKSSFVQYISLEKGGKSVKVQNEVDWRNVSSLLKVEFPLSAENSKAKYDLGLGSIERGTNTKMLYEVPAQMWADISDESQGFGVSIFSDSKTGWDKPNNNTLRMTIVHTPKHCYRKESAQHLMDIGLNRFGFAIFSHTGGVTKETILEAENFNQPMNTFVTEKHKGSLGNEFSLCSVSDDSVIIRAIKKAENSDEIVVRFNETENINQKDISFNIGNGIISAREIYASEEDFGEAKIKEGKLIFDIDAFSVKSFALKLRSYENKAEGSKSNIKNIEIPYNVEITTKNNEYKEGILPEGMTIPHELFKGKIYSGQYEFELGKERLNALQCKGQRLSVSGDGGKFVLLAAAVNGDKECEFKLGRTNASLKIADMFEYVGNWDMISSGITAHIKRDVLAHNFTHMHNKDGDVFAKYAYVFKYELSLPKGAKSIKLPEDENIFIFAALEDKDDTQFIPASLLYDAAEKRENDYWFTDYDLLKLKPTRLEHLKSRYKFSKTFVVNRALREISPFKNK